MSLRSVLSRVPSGLSGGLIALRFRWHVSASPTSRALLLRPCFTKGSTASRQCPAERVRASSANPGGRAHQGADLLPGMPSRPSFTWRRGATLSTFRPTASAVWSSWARECGQALGNASALSTGCPHRPQDSCRSVGLVHKSTRLHPAVRHLGCRDDPRAPECPLDIPAETQRMVRARAQNSRTAECRHAPVGAGGNHLHAKDAAPFSQRLVARGHRLTAVTFTLFDTATCSRWWRVELRSWLQSANPY